MFGAVKGVDTLWLRVSDYSLTGHASLNPAYSAANQPYWWLFGVSGNGHGGIYILQVNKGQQLLPPALPTVCPPVYILCRQMILTVTFSLMSETVMTSASKLQLCINYHDLHLAAM